MSKPRRPNKRERREPVRRLQPGQAAEFSHQMKYVLGWFSRPLNTEGKSVDGAEPTWVLKSAQLQQTYEELALFARADGAAWPEYRTLGHACGVGWRQAIRRAWALRSLGLAVARPEKHEDQSPTSNTWGLVRPTAPDHALAVCIRLEEKDPETGLLYQVIPLVKGLDVGALPPFPVARPPKARPQSWPVVAEPSASGSDRAKGALALPPWWAVRIAEQEGLRNLYLQARAYAILQELQAARLIRDRQRPGKCLRGICRNLRSAALQDQVEQEMLLTGQSLTAAQEIRARHGRLVNLAMHWLLQGDSAEAIRSRLLANPPELVPVRQVTAMEPHEAAQAVEEATRLLSAEDERRSQLAAAADLPAEAVTWVREGVAVLRARDAQKGRRRSIISVGDDLWSNRETYRAPASVTEPVLQAIIEAIRLQE